MAYQVKWTIQAEQGLKLVLLYLEENWTKTEILQLEYRIKVVIEQIKLFPELYPKSLQKPKFHKAIIDKNNFLIYQINGQVIEVLIFKGTKQKD